MSSELPTCCGCFVNSAYDFSQPFVESNGLTLEEKECLNHLSAAWNAFIALDKKHPSDNAEFMTAIHDAQKLVAIRVARRINPDIWIQGE